MAEKEAKAREHPLAGAIKQADEYFKKRDAKNIERGIAAYRSIAKQLREGNHLKEAREIYFRGGEILKQLKVWDEAAKMYERAGKFNMVAEVYQSAAESAENENDLRKYSAKAAEVYEHLYNKFRLVAEGKARIEESGLEKKVGHAARRAASILIVAGVLAVILSLSSELTGFSVGVNPGAFSLVGVLVFILGLIGATIYIKIKAES